MAIDSVLGVLISGKENRTFQAPLVATCLMVMSTGLLSTLANTFEVGAETQGFQIFMRFGFVLMVSTVSTLAVLECDIRDHGTRFQIIPRCTKF
jgi:hypothetical protein